MKRLAAVLLLFSAASFAAAQAAFRIELKGQPPVLSKDQPSRRGSLLVFHRYPDGVLTSVPQEQVVGVTAVEPPPASTPAAPPPPTPAPAPPVDGPKAQRETARLVPAATTPAAASPATPSVPATPAPPAAGPPLAAPAPEAAVPAQPASAPRRGKWPIAPPPAFIPTKLAQNRISLADAVRLTLENDPNLFFARQQVLQLQGAVQETSGAFDPFVTFQPSYSHQEGKLIGFALNREFNRRELHRILADQFERIANDTQAKLDAGGGRVFPDCEGADIRVNGQSICSSLIDQARGQAFDKLLQALIDAETNPNRKAELEKIQASLNDPLRQQLIQFVATLRGVVSSERDTLAKLGVLPDFEVRDTLDLDLRLHVPFRNGVTVAPVFFLEGLKDNFRNKPLNPIFGGSGVPILFTAVAGFTADASLGKGGAAVSVAAPERAAKLNFQAGLDSYAQRGSQSVFTTVIAYWNLAAAEERVELLRKSFLAQRRIGELSRGLVEGDEIPRTELDRINARTADAAAILAQAQQALTSARVALATSIGFSVEDLENAPLASDPLPDTTGVGALDAVPVQKLANDAVESRADVKAARKSREASEVLLRAARYDLKPRVDLSFQFAYNAIHESLRTDYWQPLGFGKALGGRWQGPSFELALRFQIPVANNVARGRLEQSLALRNQSAIAEKTLERIVRANTVQFVEAVRKAAVEIVDRRKSVGYYDETIQSTLDRFKAGEASLLDTILTERTVTGALLDLVSARLAFATDMSRLRFETGSLVQYARDDAGVSFGAVQPIGFSFSR